MNNNNISGNAPHKNSSSSSSNTEGSFVIIAPEVSSRGNSTSTSSFLMVEVPQNTTNPMGTIEDESGTEDSPRFGHFSPVNENSYSSSDEYENPGNIFSNTDPTSSERSSPSWDTILEEPRPLELVLNHLHELRSPKNLDRYSRILFGGQQPEDAPLALKELLNQTLILLQKAIDSSQDTKLLSYKLKVYMVILMRQCHISPKDLLHYIKKQNPEISPLLNEKLLSLLKRFARIQYDYPICKRKVKPVTNLLMDSSAQEDMVRSIEQNPEIDSLVNEIITEKTFSDIQYTLGRITELAINLGLLDDNRLDEYSIMNYVKNGDINQLINVMSLKLKEDFSELNSMDLTLSNDLHQLFEQFKTVKNIFKENIQKMIKYCNGDFNKLFLYLCKANCPSHLRESVFANIILLQNLNELSPNMDELRLVILVHSLGAKYSSGTSPHLSLLRDNLIKYYSLLFPHDPCLSQLLEQLKIRGLGKGDRDDLKERIKELMVGNQIKPSNNIIQLQQLTISLVRRLRTLHTNTDGSYAIPSDLQSELKALLEQDQKSLLEILKKENISLRITIDEEIKIFEHKKSKTSPIRLLINRLLDLKADANGNYTIPEGLKIVIQKLYNNNTQLVTDLIEQGISQGLTNELIIQATQHLELVDNQPQAELLERKNETSEDNE